MPNTSTEAQWAHSAVPRIWRTPHTRSGDTGGEGTVFLSPFRSRLPVSILLRNQANTDEIAQACSFVCCSRRCPNASLAPSLSCAPGISGHRTAADRLWSFDRHQLLRCAGQPRQRLGWFTPLLVAPLGATAVLVFCVPNSPLAQPWSAVVGNVTSAIVALLVLRFVPAPWATGGAVGAAVVAMMLMRALHPLEGRGLADGT